MRTSDWLKLFDPLNTAKMSARYKNRLIVPRLIIVANYKPIEKFFGDLEGEDLDQFIRRINYKSIITESTSSDKSEKRIYKLFASKKLDFSRSYNLSQYKTVNLKYDHEQLLEKSNQDEFIKELLNSHIYPRIYPK